MLCYGQGILDGAQEELEVVDDAVFGSECGLSNIRAPVFHIITNDLSFFGCVHHSVASVVV